MLFPFNLPVTLPVTNERHRGPAEPCQEMPLAKVTHAWTDSRSSKASLSSLLSSCSFCEASITLSARSRSRSLRRGLGKEGFTACVGTRPWWDVQPPQRSHQQPRNAGEMLCMGCMYLSILLHILQGAPHPGFRLLGFLGAGAGQAEAAVALLGVDQRWGTTMG